MTGGAGQAGRIDAAVMAEARQRTMSQVGVEIDAYMTRPCWPAFADGMTGIQHMRATMTPLQRTLAAAEWDAMDARGNLPADWPERRAQIEADFADYQRDRAEETPA